MNTNIFVIAGMIAFGYYFLRKPPLPNLKTGQGIADLLINDPDFYKGFNVASVEKVSTNSARFKDLSGNIVEIGYDPANNSYYRIKYVGNKMEKVVGNKLEDVIS